MNSAVNSASFPKLNGQNQTIPFESRAEDLSQEEYSEALLEDLGISSRQFRILFDNLTPAISLCKMVYDGAGAPTDFVTLDANPSFVAAFDTKREQVILRKASDCEPFKECFVELMKIYGENATTGKPAQCEVYCQAQDKWYQIYAYTPKKDYFISVFTDLTERKKAEQQLLASEKRYRRLYETTRDGIMARDLKGRMIDCNQAYAKMLGYTKKELRNLTVHQLLPRKWHEQRERVVNKVLQTGRSIVFEREYRRKDGSVFPASVRTWRLTDGKGSGIGIWSIVRDISEQKAHQKHLEKQAESLERIVEERTKQLKDSERLAAIGQTAGMVGHDLRNPLQTVIGELFLAKSEVDALPESAVKNNLRESIQVLEEQAAYMDKIVSDLQAFVKPVRIDKSPVAVKETVDAVVTSIEIPSNITVLMRIGEHFPQIRADPQLLKRVLINLVTNSVQAMPNGGKLTLKSRVNQGGHVSISVEDTGVGIAESIKPQIFTPLFTTKPRGQGFGLAVCKRVIEAHGGTISFESQEGKGAKFTIRLPLG